MSDALDELRKDPDNAIGWINWVGALEARIEALEARLQEAGLPIFGPSNRDRIDALEKLTDPRWLDDLHTEAHKDLAADVHRLEAQVLGKKPGHTHGWEFSGGEWRPALVPPKDNDDNAPHRRFLPPKPIPTMVDDDE